MFTYFIKDREDTHFPIKKYTQFDYIKKRYLTELDKVVSNYRNKERATNNTHVLNRLIKTIAPDIGLDIIDYLNIVNSTAKEVSKQFHIVSTINKGNIFNNLFYKENANEILLYVENDIDLEFIKNNFYRISPINVIYSEDADLDYYVPYGNKNMQFDSLFIYSIDVITLMLQYRYWALDRKNNGYGTDVNVFLGMIVIPNLAYSIFDFGLLNRFLNIIKGVPSSTPKNIHTFDIVNFSNTVDIVYEKIYKDIKGDRILLEHVLKSIPMVMHKTAYELLKINSKYNTSQNEWVIWLSRIFIIYNLLVLMDKGGRATNSGLVNSIPNTLRNLKNRSTSFSALPNSIHLELEDVIEKIKNII